MKQIVLVLILGGLISMGESVFAGAWTQKQSHFYSKISFLRFASTSQYLHNGKREPLSENGTVTDIGVHYYLEYGFFDELTVIVSIPFKRINFSCAIEDCNYSSSGFGDLYFGLRYRLSHTNWIISLQSGIKIAPGYETDAAKLNSAPPLGDDQMDFDMHLQIGRSIFNYNGYFNLDAGYRLRSNEPVDEIPFMAELGLDLSKDYLFIGKLYGVRSLSMNENKSDFKIVNGQVVNFIGTGELEDFVKALNWTSNTRYRVDDDMFDRSEKLITLRDDKGKAAFYDDHNEFKKFMASRDDTYGRMSAMRWARDNKADIRNIAFVDHRGRVYERGLISPQSGEAYRGFLSTSHKKPLGETGLRQLRDDVGAFLGGMSDELEGRFNSLTVSGRQSIANKWHNDLVDIGNLIIRRKPNDLRKLIVHPLVQQVED